MSEIKIEYPIGGFAPGNYSNKCATCGTDFVGDKRARQCEPCAINGMNRITNKALNELSQLKTALLNIELNYKTINNALKQVNGETKQQDAALHLRGVSGCLLPTKSQLEQVIEEDYKQQYGTNYDGNSLENAKQGGLIITNWILNNR